MKSSKCQRRVTKSLRGSDGGMKRDMRLGYEGFAVGDSSQVRPTDSCYNGDLFSGRACRTEEVCILLK